VREVGETVVFEGVDIGRVEVRWCRGVEGLVKRGEGRGVTRWRIEGVHKAAVGILRVADQHEVHIVTGHTLLGELRHDLRGSI
jgi:hypothetical protein